MLRIRLRRVGKKKQPMYRIVVADSRSPRDGAFVESLGYYNPLDNPSTIVIDSDRARHWLDRGAQPSERVSKLHAIKGIAELPPKLKARIELGQQRAQEAQAAEKAKPKAEVEAPVAVAEEPAPAAEASVGEPPAEGEQPQEPEPAAGAEEQTEA